MNKRSIGATIGWRYRTLRELRCDEKALAIQFSRVSNDLSKLIVKDKLLTNLEKQRLILDEIAELKKKKYS